MRLFTAAAIGSLIAMAGTAWAACPPYCPQQQPVQRYVPPPPPPPPRQVYVPPPPPRQVYTPPPRQVQAPPPRQVQQAPQRPVVRSQNDGGGRRIETYNPQPVTRKPWEGDRKLTEQHNRQVKTQADLNAAQIKRQGGGCTVNNTPYDNLQACKNGFSWKGAGQAWDNLSGAARERETKSSFLNDLRARHDRACASSCKAPAAKIDNTPCDRVGCRNGG